MRNYVIKTMFKKTQLVLQIEENLTTFWTRKKTKKKTKKKNKVNVTNLLTFDY